MRINRYSYCPYSKARVFIILTRILTRAYNFIHNITIYHDISRYIMIYHDISRYITMYHDISRYTERVGFDGCLNKRDSVTHIL